MIEWHILAVFDTKEQAKQAAMHMVAINAREYTFTAIEDGRKVWQETGGFYGAREQSV